MLYESLSRHTYCDTPCRPSHRTSKGTIPFISVSSSATNIFEDTKDNSPHLFLHNKPSHSIRQHKVLTGIHPPGICRRPRSRQIEITIFQIMCSNNTHGTDLIGPGYYYTNDPLIVTYINFIKIQQK